MKILKNSDLQHISGGYPVYPPVEYGWELVGWEITGYTETRYLKEGLFWNTEIITRDPVIQPLYLPRHVETVTYLY